MDQPPPVTLRLSHEGRARLNRIAADMGRPPADLASAIVEQWTALILANLAPKIRKPSGPSRPDFIRSGVIDPPQEDEL